MFTKRILFLTASIFVLFIAPTSTPFYEIRCDSFAIIRYRPDPNDKNYIALNDGSFIYGKNISWTSGILSSITIDQQKFKISEVKNFRLNSDYFVRFGSQYIRRIIGGKVNVYYSDYSRNETIEWKSGGSSRKTLTSCYFYAQEGDDGEINEIKNHNDILKYVNDCPKSAEMLNKTDKELRKAIHSKSNYLNEVFEVYNNDCK